VAAIAHAQFETIHPFEDGNGRTGRALIHTVLKREGVMRHTVLPISIVFANDTRDYIAGLNAFRETPPRAGDWLQGFAAATEAAAATTLELQRRVQHLDELLVQRLLDWRVEHGRSARPRPEATVLRIIQGLASEPVMTTKGVADRFGVSTVAADNALKELTAAGIVSKQKHKGAVVCYASDEHLAIVSLAERRLFAGGWDTAQRPTNSELALPNTEIDWRSAEDAARRDQVD
jgi:Fic family protein